MWSLCFNLYPFSVTNKNRNEEVLSFLDNPQNQRQNIVWKTSGRQTIVRICAHRLAPVFPVAVRWLGCQQEFPSSPNDQMRQVSPSFLHLRIVPCTDLLLLRRPSQKLLCGEAARCFLRHLWSDKTSYHVLCFLILLSGRLCSWSIIISAVLSQLPSGLSEQVPYNFFSDPGPKKDQPTTAKKSASVPRNCDRILHTSFCVSFFTPYNVVVHWHGDDPVVELLRFTLYIFHKNFESLRGCLTSWILGTFSTRTPSAYRRCDSVPWSDYSLNTILFCSSKLHSDHLPSSPHKALNRRRCRSWHWWSDKLCCTISLSIST